MEHDDKDLMTLVAGNDPGFFGKVIADKLIVNTGRKRVLLSPRRDAEGSEFDAVDDNLAKNFKSWLKFKNMPLLSYFDSVPLICLFHQF